MPALSQHPGARGNSSVMRPMPALAGDQVDLPVERQVIEHRRNRRGERDGRVRHLEEFRHQERGGAHHRRHQLPAGRADRLDRAGVARGL